MDITFKTTEGIFNYRVCGIILHEEKILAMRNPRTPYYYLPGGRVRLHEAAEDALRRELREELEVDVRIIRPLWLNQGFFIEDVTGDRFHEICIYFLVDISGTDLLARGDSFVRQEGTQTNMFRWLDIHRLEDTYLYPKFLKRKIFDLPQTLTIQAEYE